MIAYLQTLIDWVRALVRRGLGIVEKCLYHTCLFISALALACSAAIFC